MPLYLLRYAELGLKSDRVRAKFLNRLIENIETGFIRAGMECIVTSDRGRVFVLSDEGERSRDIIRRTFGVVSFSEVAEVPPTLQEISESASELASKLLKRGNSFAIRARRSGGQKFTSVDIAKECGSKILRDNADLEITVDLEHPDVEIYVEAREKAAYIFTKSEKGPGGLPLGTQGRVACLVTSDEDVIIPWLMMRRGCDVVIGYMGSADLTPLAVWCAGIEAETLERPGDIVPMAARKECNGIALPGDGSSYAEYTDGKHGLAVFYPAAGLSASERRKLLEKIA
jgi:thiamine biosynthesis protein ThiI